MLSSVCLPDDSETAVFLEMLIKHLLDKIIHKAWRHFAGGHFERLIGKHMTVQHILYV